MCVVLNIQLCGYWEGWDPEHRLTKPVWWLSLRKLPALNIACVHSMSYPKFRLRFCLDTLLFLFPVGEGNSAVGLSEISTFFSIEEELDYCPCSYQSKWELS